MGSVTLALADVAAPHASPQASNALSHRGVQNSGSLCFTNFFSLGHGAST